MAEKCPRCGSSQTAPILYGMPVLDNEMEAMLKAKQLYIGGCCVSGDDPKYHCFGCNLNFHNPPHITSEKHSSNGERKTEEDFERIRKHLEGRAAEYFMFMDD